MRAADPVIVVEHVYKRFGSNAVLKDFSLTVQARENVVVPHHETTFTLAFPIAPF
ncbi:hypothetical protein [Mucilaginibacter terrenus]|uniref:hypothetical protein n=1 Tax=Mucilaginibacter terrenus TaxID=2482727 RepID=UPI00197B53DC|nr:hypothetical protein [Mucilaginibacter terrenus]